MLYTLVYTSDTLTELDSFELHNLLAQARDKNKRLGITGILLYHDKRFIQVLEGDKTVVLSMYEEIKVDTRHTNVVTTMQNKIDSRMFPDWAMGYKDIDPIIYKNIPGLTLFIDDAKVAKPHDLLLSFRDDVNCFENDRSA